MSGSRSSAGWIPRPAGIFWGRLGIRGVLALALLALPASVAKVLEGHVTGSAQLHSADPHLVVLGTFGFECIMGTCGKTVPEAEAAFFEKGMIHIEAHGDPFIKGQEIAMFSSEPWVNKSAWKQIWRNRQLSCAAKRQHAIFTLPLTTSEGEPVDYRASNVDAVDFYHALRLSSRPLFVHIVALNCAPEYQGALSMYYKVTLQNPGGWWGAQFSYDDQSILRTHILAFLALGALAALAAHSLIGLQAAQLSHPPLLVLGGALGGFALSHLLDIFFYADYASHGHGPEGVLVMSEVLSTCSDLVVMVLYLMLSQGWRITDDHMPQRDQMLIGGAVLVYCVCYVLIYTVDYALRDPADEVYVLLTTGAFFLVLIRIMLFALCCLFFYDTYHREPSVQKQTFFRRAIVSCAIWFLQLPFTCLIAASTSSSTRHRVATGWMATVNTLTLAYLLYVFQPSRAKDYFTITATGNELAGLTSDMDDEPMRDRPPLRSSVVESERYAPLAEERGREPRLAVPDEGML